MKNYITEVFIDASSHFMVFHFNTSNKKKESNNNNCVRYGTVAHF